MHIRQYGEVHFKGLWRGPFSKAPMKIPRPLLIYFPFYFRIMESFAPHLHFTDKETESWRGAVSCPCHADHGQGQ